MTTLNFDLRLKGQLLFLFFDRIIVYRFRILIKSFTLIRKNYILIKQNPFIEYINQFKI